MSFTLVGTVAVVLSAAVTWFIRKWLPSTPKRLQGNQESVIIFFNAFELMYAVLIAFVVFVTWTSYDNTQRSVAVEAAKLSTLYMNARGLPADTQGKARRSIAHYTAAILIYDWDAMRLHSRSPQPVYRRLGDVWNAHAVVAEPIGNPQMYYESIRQLNSLAEYRRLRFLASRESVPAAIWFVLAAGALAAVAYTPFLGTGGVKSHIVMTSTFAALNAMILFLIFVLDHPFTGYSAIDDRPFEDVFRMFVRMRR